VSVSSSLVVPKRALMHGAQGPFVWVLGAGEQVAPRVVELGPSSGNDVAVASGLASGDRVVVDGILKVQPGAVVRTTMLAADGAPLPPSNANASLPRAASPP
jgi:multidrug efflux pump subunit AcrA (membrane-fusion protein)